MLTIPSFHIGYADVANQSLRNISSSAWVIFSPSNEFLDSAGIFLSRATNNIAKNEAMITLMTKAYALGFHSSVVRLDSELVIS